MGYTRIPEGESEIINVALPPPQRQRWLLHTVLFVLTILSCFLAGLVWSGYPLFNEQQVALTSEHFSFALSYALLIIFFISAHEFGHFFAAKYHGVDATLPFYIPLPPILLPSFGTMGAVIRTRSPILSRKALFDIGVAGPLAGFAACLLILIVGFATLPPIEYLQRMCPEYSGAGSSEGLTAIVFGDTLIFRFLATLFANPQGFLPPMSEIIHYPFLTVGWFGLFVTSLNLLPVGQLDGGHILYSMFGSKQGRIAKIIMTLMLVVGLGGVLAILLEALQLESPDTIYTMIQSAFLPALLWLKEQLPWVLTGWTGWLIWVLFARIFFGIHHPPIADPEPIDTKRRVIGWVAIIVFILSVSPAGINIYEIEKEPLKPNEKIVQRNHNH